MQLIIWFDILVELLRERKEKFDSKQAKLHFECLFGRTPQ